MDNENDEVGGNDYDDGMYADGKHADETRDARDASAQNTGAQDADARDASAQNTGAQDASAPNADAQDASVQNTDAQDANSPEVNLARLAELLGEVDADTRGLAAVALARVPGAEAASMLAGLLSDPDSRVICAAERSLAERAEASAVPDLMKLVASDDAEVRCGAISALAQIGDSRAFPPVVVALFDADEQVRRNAAAALGKLGDARASEPLKAALSDPYSWVRGNAALSLGSLGIAGAYDALLDQLFREDDEMVRGDIFMALADFGQGSVPRLIQAVGDALESQKGRAGAAMALAKLAEQGNLQDVAAARDAIVAILSREGSAPDEVRAASAWALGRFESNPASVAALAGALHDDYRWTVLYAVESLALLKDSTAIEPLRSFRETCKGDAELFEHVGDAIREIQRTRA